MNSEPTPDSRGKRGNTGCPFHGKGSIPVPAAAGFTPSQPEREARLHAFLSTPNGDFVCHAGQAALKVGRIALQHLPSLVDVGGKACDGYLGEVPYFRNLTGVQDAVLQGVTRIAKGELDSVVFIAPEDPLNHIQAFNRTHAFLEVVYLSGMVFGRGTLAQLSAADRREFRDDYFRQLNLAKNLTQTVLAPLEAKNDQLIVAGMSPLYVDQVPGKRYPRWAPVFCFAVTSWNTFNHVRESQPAMTARIMETALSRVQVPYEPILSYIIPDHPEFQAVAALAFGQGLIGAINQLAGRMVVLAEENRLIQAISAGTYTLIARGVLKDRSEIRSPRGIAALIRLLTSQGLIEAEAGARIAGDVERLRDSGGGGSCPFSH